MKKEKWIIAQRDENRIKSLQKTLGISGLAAAVLSARGMDAAAAAQEFMNCGSRDLYDPFLMADMDKAAALLEEAIEGGERIAVYGDYDVDGITATSILIRYLRTRGADCRYYIPDRINEGYGLNECAITALKEDGCTLLVTVDSGITAAREIEHARSLGIRVIVTDHH
ncbi:MAG: DHH family phosphoesterase, partial [Clostridia bacterium]|nr:DHH family phosphoesterase [Clostridia bacterium]